MAARSIFKEAKTPLSFLFRNRSFAAPLSQPVQKPWLPEQNLRPEIPSSSSKSVFERGEFESRMGMFDLNHRKLAQNFGFALKDLSRVEARGNRRIDDDSNDDSDDDSDYDSGDDSDDNGGDYTMNDLLNNTDSGKRNLGAMDNFW